MSELSLLESLFDCESRLVAASPELVFDNLPSSVDDPPGQLSTSHKDSMEFLSFKISLETWEVKLRKVSSLDHQDVRHRRNSLLQKLSEARERLLSVERYAWEYKKISAGLYGLPNEDETSGPKIYQTGTTFMD